MCRLRLRLKEMHADYRRNLEFDPAAAAKAEETIKMKLEGYERILSKQAWIGGNEMTLADLFHLPYGGAITRVRYALFRRRNHRGGIRLTPGGRP